MTLAGLPLQSPIVMASGILGIGRAMLLRVAEGRIGAVVPKSCCIEPRAGHPNPTVIDYGWGLSNAVGLSNPGVTAEVEELAGLGAELTATGARFIASVFEATVDGFGRVTELVQACQPDMIELNISCPNTESDLGRMFAAEPSAAAAAVGAARRATRLPIIAKLSPNVTDITEIARACEAAGADILACCNTFGPGMTIDLTSGRPVLANRTGGISGPAMLPLAVAKVAEVTRAVQIPVIGIGGVTTGEAAAQMLAAGATAVGVGSAVWYRREVPPPAVPGLIADELETVLESLGTTAAELRGRVHHA